YNNERKLQLFADFTYQGGKLAIRNLYFAPKTRGKVLIEGSLPAEEVSSISSGGLGYATNTRGEVIIEGSLPEEEVSSTSSSGLGYGLEIVWLRDYEAIWIGDY
ncbi:MAG: hypothetical protein IKD73_06070, partial [Selenomonadaceae bacterium]|nr:hypothetical protein [Selenomonadaceae bacterium]